MKLIGVMGNSGSGKTTFTDNTVLYADWDPNNYTIKYDGNGATSGKMSTLKNKYYTKDCTLTANKYKKKGYVFVGWNTEKDGSGISYKNKEKVQGLTTSKGKTVTLYAQWEKKGK